MTTFMFSHCFRKGNIERDFEILLSFAIMEDKH
jgi:hypothetical protein